MKRFLIFAGSCYYPSGGWEDFKGAADTEVEALKVAANAAADWWHVVDTTTGTIAHSGESGTYA